VHNIVNNLKFNANQQKVDMLVQKTLTKDSKLKSKQIKFKIPTKQTPNPCNQYNLESLLIARKYTYWCQKVLDEQDNKNKRKNNVNMLENIQNE